MSVPLLPKDYRSKQQQQQHKKALNWDARDTGGARNMKCGMIVTYKIIIVL